MSILSKEGEFLIGKNYILMKQGTLRKMRIYLNGMIDTAEEMTNNLKQKILNMKKEKENNKIIKGRKSTVFVPLKIEEKMRIKLGDINDKKYSKDNIINFNALKLEFESAPLPNKKKFQPLAEDNSRRHLLKEQCILNIISNGKIINSDEKNKIMKNRSFNIYHLISHRDKVLEGLENDKKDSIDLEEIQININIKEKDSISNDSSIIKTKKNIDKGKKKSSKNQEYSNNLNYIIKIQSQVRRMISKNKYIILKYIYSEIILIQKFVRGHLTRVKFKKFLDCLQKIKTIQRLYHRRYSLKVKYAVRIQEFWLKRLKIKKFKEKIIAKKRAEAKGEYYNMNLESFEDFSLNNYKLENNLRKIELQKNNNNLTKQLIKEKDPKKVVQILLYGADGKNKLTRAQKYNMNLNIEDKLLRQGEIMKKRKNDLADKYEKKYLENNPYIPLIPKYNNEILGNKYPGEFLKRMEFYKLFKEKNLEELKQNQKSKEIIENKKTENENDSEKTIQNKKKNYDYYIKNAFDRLHNEQIQIEQSKKRKSQDSSRNYIFKELLLNSNEQQVNNNDINNAKNENKKIKKEYL
jgi:hypothetical protein